MEEERYTEALIKEIELQKEFFSLKEKIVSSIFFGGGTPSLFKSESFFKILSAINKHFKINDKIEITLEANPGTLKETLDREKLSEFRKLGLNRISFGSQSFNQEKLKFLGRIHAVGDTKIAFNNAREAGFLNINLDLIFGLKNESLDVWKKDLEEAIFLDPEHISAYSLTIEPGTEFGKRTKAGEDFVSKDDLSAKMFLETISKLEESGYNHYEISNYAKKDRSCAHNLNYWNRSSYLGLGAGAHGFINNTGSYGSRYFNLPGPKHYIEKIESGKLAIQSSENLNEEQAKLEFFLLGLRKKEGIRENRYSELFKEDFNERYGELVLELKNKELLDSADKNHYLTKKGFLFANSIYEEFASLVS